MHDILKDKSEDIKPSLFGCKTCHIWKKQSRTLKTKLDKALKPKVTFDIDTSKYDMPFHNPYKMYNFVGNGPNSKSSSSHNLCCHYCCKKGHIIAKCKFRRLLVPK